MDYIAAAISDMGSRNGVNQDALLVKSRLTCMGNVCIGAICDGIGGLALGEEASSYVVRRLSDWFTYKIGEIGRFDKLVYYVGKELGDCSREIYEYGRKRQIMLGTTATVILISGGSYAVVHVGDTRAYKFTKGIIGGMKQLTVDQSVNDYMLTQSVGMGERVRPVVMYGSACRGDIFLLCTDGFRHKNNNEIIKKGFMPQVIKKKEDMEKNLSIYVDRARSLGEKDDISVFTIKLV